MDDQINANMVKGFNEIIPLLVSIKKDVRLMANIIRVSLILLILGFLGFVLITIISVARLLG
jgi:hypothetical protein